MIPRPMLGLTVHTNPVLLKKSRKSIHRYILQQEVELSLSPLQMQIPLTCISVRDEAIYCKYPLLSSFGNRLASPPHRRKLRHQIVKQGHVLQWVRISANQKSCSKFCIDWVEFCCNLVVGQDLELTCHKIHHNNQCIALSGQGSVLGKVLPLQVERMFSLGF